MLPLSLNPHQRYHTLLPLGVRSLSWIDHLLKIGSPLRSTCLRISVPATAFDLVRRRYAFTVMHARSNVTWMTEPKARVQTAGSTSWIAGAYPYPYPDAVVQKPLTLKGLVPIEESPSGRSIQIVRRLLPRLTTRSRTSPTSRILWKKRIPAKVKRHPSRYTRSILATWPE